MTDCIVIRIYFCLSKKRLIFFEIIYFFPFLPNIPGTKKRGIFKNLDLYWVVLDTRVSTQFSIFKNSIFFKFVFLQFWKKVDILLQKYCVLWKSGGCTGMCQSNATQHNYQFLKIWALKFVFETFIGNLYLKKKSL